MFLSSTSNERTTSTYEAIKRRRDKANVIPERGRRLDCVGFVRNASESRWEKGFAALAKFKARKGHCRVPWRHTEGKFKLGQWVAQQRKAKDRIPSKYRKRLNAIGYVWDGHEHAWEEGFAALTKFKACNGHCRVPRYHIENGYKLGQWVSVQRLNRDTLSVERRKRLDAIGFVWDGRKHYWEKGFIALAKFKAREGYCPVPSLHIENEFKLGQWVTTKRRSKANLPSEHKLQLDKIGFVWCAILRSSRKDLSHHREF